MRFLAIPITGAYLIEPEPASDERGFFARTLDAAEFAQRGLVVPNAQWSISYNAKRGTLRGLHYQAPPHEEVKLVRCTRGAVYDVVADLRTKTWYAVELSAENRLMLYVPRGVAHGFQTLADDSELMYFIDVPYAPKAARGVRWDDPDYSIDWPIASPIMSERDRTL